jgi:AcrR family transcriptional regulator
MARTKKISVDPRKHPLQPRSQKMVRAILDASRKLLLKYGYDEFNTNRIAELAGISVGSLYQYFPNKESIASRLMEDFFQTVLTRNMERTSEFLALPVEAAVQLAAEQVLLHREDIKLYRILVEDSFGCIDKSIIKLFYASYIEMLQQRFIKRKSEVDIKDPYMAAFVVFHLLEGILRSLARFESEVEPARVLAEVSAVIRSYLYSLQLGTSSSR